MVDPSSIVPTVQKAYKLAKELGKLTPDAAIGDAWREQLEEIGLDTARRVQALERAIDNPHIPTEEDVKQAAEDFAKACDKAGNHRKRWMLVHAFLGRLHGQFYENGMNNILWRIAEQIEYPEAYHLSELLERLESEVNGLRIDVGSKDKGRIDQRTLFSYWEIVEFSNIQDGIGVANAEERDRKLHEFLDNIDKSGRKSHALLDGLDAYKAQAAKERIAQLHRFTDIPLYDRLTPHSDRLVEFQLLVSTPVAERFRIAATPLAYDFREYCLMNAPEKGPTKEENNG